MDSLRTSRRGLLTGLVLAPVFLPQFRDSLKGSYPGPFMGAGRPDDDTGRLAEAINRQQVQGGEVALEPGKVYNLASWTQKTTKSKLILRGNGATLVGPSRQGSFISPLNEVQIENVVFEGWDGVVERTAPAVPIPVLRVQGCHFVNCRGIAINIEAACPDYLIEGNVFRSNTGGYNIRIGRNVYSEQDNWAGIVRRNWFTNISGLGSASTAAIIAYGRDTRISENVIRGVRSDAGGCYGIYTKLRRSEITANEITDVASANSRDVVGINVKGAERLAHNGPQGFLTSASKNVIRNVGIPGQVGYGIRLQSTEQKAFLNLVENFGLIGIDADESGGGVTDVEIYDNLIRGTGAPVEDGIRLSFTGQLGVATGNRVTNCAYGIRVSGVGPQEKFSVVGNYLKAPSEGVTVGVYIAGANPKQDLEIRNNVGEGWKFGILVDPLSRPMRDRSWLISGNRFGDSSELTAPSNR